MLIRNLIGFLLLISSFSVLHADEKEQEHFLRSFINYYDFSTVGRYTHEYHPFLFQKSSYSLDEMEKSITDSGLEIKGRIVIAGYEERSVPSYFTNYKVCTGSKINDEVHVRGRAGWSSQLHNKFGLMTGFLFRDSSTIKQPLCEHVNLNLMPIFDRDSWIFQKHAFGRIFNYMIDMQYEINSDLIRGNSKKMFSDLISFWRTIYEQELQYGNRQVLGTQDVLFSIAHAEHLYRSTVPLLKYYTGPDITYPIKITSAQKKSATRHAQTFVKKFTNNLKPVDGKKTVYIFCSFVDGVGKSTLLGNTQNYKKYGDNVGNYASVDNSSSQLAALYEYDKDVFIADLPAQMSHFTYKPDGMVYFDLQASDESDASIAEVGEFVRKNRDDLIKNYKAAFIDVYKTFLREGCFAESLGDRKRPERVFIKNLILLNKDEGNLWMPFSFKDKNYLFNVKNSDIRILVSLEHADSVGLKNYESEQMLFFEGLRFPVLYKHFISDLISQLKSRGIEKVLFVDFLSMYPRSSRENIRINYLLQQLAILNSDFSVERSTYGTYVNDAQLLYKLKYDPSGSITKYFREEAVTRLCLYNLMQEKQFDSIEGVPLKTVTEFISEQHKKLSPGIKKLADSLSKEKIEHEVEMLTRVHGKTKNYVNIQELDFDLMISFQDALRASVEKNFSSNKSIKKLWRESKGEVVELYVVSPDCKDPMVLAPILRTIRASWYCMIINLLDKDEYRYFVAPVWLKKREDGNIVVYRRAFGPCDRAVSDYVGRTLSLLNISENDVADGWSNEPTKWGILNGIPYLLSLDKAKTDLGIFSLGLSENHILKKYKDKYGAEKVIPTSDLWKKVSRSLYYIFEYKRVIESAKKQTNTSKKDDKKMKIRYFKDDGEQTPIEEQKISLGKKEDVELWKFVIHSIALLEMIVKDVNSDVVVRRGNKSDFGAALHLLEKVALPTYFGTIYEQNLFNDYSKDNFLR